MHVDGLDDLSVPPEVGGYQAKIIRVWKSDCASCAVFSVKFVAALFLHVLQMKKHRIKDHEEDSGTQWITLKNPTPEVEWVRSP